jgi:hypothetical protein
MRSKNQRRSVLPILLMVLGVILIIGAIIWMVVGVPPQTNVLPTPTAVANRIPYPDVKRVGLADAKAAFEIGSAVFVDVRGEPYYSQSHIPGALSIGEDELEARINELDLSAWIITYCT